MNNEFGILQRADEERRAKESEIRDATLNRRTKRELDRFYISGRINNFLKRSAENNRSVNDAINQIQKIRLNQSSLPEITFLATQKNEIEGSETEARDPKNFGTTTSVPAEGGGGTFIAHPWQISRKIEDNIVYFKVNPNSVVFAGVGTFEEVAISGLDSWEEGVGGHVTLHGTVEQNQLTGLEVVWGEDGGGEPRAEYDGQNRQTLLKTRLGFIYEDSSGRLRVRQEAFSNFTAIMSCYDSKPTICLIQT